MVAGALTCLLQQPSPVASFITPCGINTKTNTDGKSAPLHRRLSQRDTPFVTTSPWPLRMRPISTGFAAAQKRPPSPWAIFGATGEAAVNLASPELADDVGQHRGRAVNSTAEAKRELLYMLASFARGADAEPSATLGTEVESLEQQGKKGERELERMKYLLETLEGSYIPIQTVGFFNLATKVRWA